MRFRKYQALGNDYLAVSACDAPVPLTKRQAQFICNRHYGPGGDGILQQRPAKNGDFGLIIYNSDGSVAEKSGNGLRIFARFLREEGLAGGDSFSIETPGGVCPVRFEEGPNGEEWIAVNMGAPVFRSAAIPVKGPDREMIEEPVVVEGMVFAATALSMGNPHCVIFRTEASLSEMRQWGPKIETHSMFPNKTNVQFAEVLSDGRAKAFVWERGSGETMASGSSACAIAAAGQKTRRFGPDVLVKMPGGELKVKRLASGELELVGPADPVAELTLAPSFLKSLDLL